MHRVAVLAGALLIASCGTPNRDLELVIDPIDDVEQLESITELRVRVFTVDDVEEPYATATSPSGATIEGISCAAIRQLESNASDCTETTRRVVRDRDLVHEGPVPADGAVTIAAPAEQLRVRVDLPGIEISISPSGRVCTWIAAEMVDSEVTTTTIPVRPRC